ncbi:flagellar biosynthesis protein FlhB [Lachnospiraceae bacterium ZAX-1]
MKLNDKKLFVLKYNLQWFAKDGPGGEKTEPATAKKLGDARKEGQVAKSKELTLAVDLIVLFFMLKLYIPYVGNSFILGFKEIYTKIPDFVTAGSNQMPSQMVAGLINSVLVSILKICAPFFIAGLATAILVNLVQVGWRPTAKPMMPKLSKINPVSGFKRIFSKDSLFELAKSLAKLLLMGYLAYDSIKDQKDVLLFIYDIPLMSVILLIGSIVIDIGLKIAYVYLIVAIIDFVYQKHKFKEDMKMTKQEVKDEFKNIEGNPEIKGRQRQRMREASQRRMMQDLPKADVVITNPTHLAVAIKYDAEQNRAPLLIAKGEDYLALKIRETAKEHQIEIVENKPLARMLYTTVDIGQEVPPELYQAVAEVLAFVYSLKHK